MLRLLSMLIKYTVKHFAMKDKRHRDKIISIQDKKIQCMQKKTFEDDLCNFSDEAKYLFGQLMKNRRLSREDILDFDKFIDSCLGNCAKEYNTKKYSNDAHRIYTKLQSYYLSKNNYREILHYLREIN